MGADVTILAALLAGLVSFLSPCVLPLVPPYLVYLAGTSLELLADDDPKTGGMRDTVLAASTRADETLATVIDEVTTRIQGITEKLLVRSSAEPN